MIVRKRFLFIKSLARHTGFCSEFESIWESVWNTEKVKKLILALALSLAVHFFIFKMREVYQVISKTSFNSADILLLIAFIRKKQICLWIVSGYQMKGCNKRYVNFYPWTVKEWRLCAHSIPQNGGFVLRVGKSKMTSVLKS